MMPLDVTHRALTSETRIGAFAAPGRECHVEIETRSELTRGMTVVDWWGLTDGDPNCLVMREIDDDRYFELLTERIGRL